MNRYRGRGLVLLFVVLTGCGAAGSSGAPARAGVSARSTAAATSPTGSTPAPSSRPVIPSTAGSPAIPAGVGFVSAVPRPRGCLVVGPAVVGVKVYLVQKALHLVNHHEIYDHPTTVAVTTFQRSRRLPQTGLVDVTTWNALGPGYPFCVDRYTAQPTVAATAPTSAHVAPMTAYAKARIGLPYIWGGAGPIGYDCSGLALQSLYAGGRVLPGVTTDKHVQATYNTAKAIYSSSALQHVPLAQRRPGDLVFWGSDFHHMAIYLGGDSIVEAVRPVVRSASLWSHGTPLPMVARPAA